MGTTPGAKDYRQQQQDVLRETKAEPSGKGQAVSDAIEAMHRQHRSDGRPFKFEPFRTE